MERHSDSLRLLTEIGFAAAQHGLGRQAGPIFEALEQCRPESAAGAIGRALVALNRGQAEEAVRILKQDALPIEPAGREVRSVLALALRLAGRNHESAEILSALLAADGADNTARMARELLAAR